jgi:hypothetical protein
LNKQWIWQKIFKKNLLKKMGGTIGYVTGKIILRQYKRQENASEI